MVSRRKYKDGGRVPIPADAMTPPPAPPEASAPAASAPPDDSIVRLLQDQQAAEARAATPPTIEQQIDEIEGISDHKGAFLRKHPEFVAVPSMAPVLTRLHQQALARGIADDTDEMDQAIVDGCRIEHERLSQRERTAIPTLTPPAPPPPPPPRGPPVSA